MTLIQTTHELINQGYCVVWYKDVHGKVEIRVVEKDRVVQLTEGGVYDHHCRSLEMMKNVA